MKLKPGFITRKIVNDTVLIDTEHTDRLLRLNETAADILSLLTEGLSEAEIVSRMMEMYAIDEATASRDVHSILDEFKALGAIEDESSL